MFTWVHLGLLGFTWVYLVDLGDVRDLLSENEGQFLGGGGLEESITTLPRYRDPIGSNSIQTVLQYRVNVKLKKNLIFFLLFLFLLLCTQIMDPFLNKTS